MAFTASRYQGLQCHECGNLYPKEAIHSFCTSCNQPLVAMYDLTKPPMRPIWDHMSKLNMWAWKSFLPVLDDHNIVTLGEGMTEVYPLSRWIQSNGWNTSIWMKDEAGNPTGSFKARGMSAAVSKAVELGIKHFCTPTAGNAGSALAAYAAKAGAKATVFMPELTPQIFSFDVELMGSEVYKVPGSIRDAGMKMAEFNKDGKAWDVSTLKEPFRLEGKKTMGYELAAQFDYQLPDVIFYPTGGGTGLIGIWKAFLEMKEMGWIDAIPTRMVAVQVDKCAPIVKAWKQNKMVSEVWENPGETAANGLRVPKAFGDKLILKALKESNGFAVEISEERMLEVVTDFAQKEGLFISPEGACCAAAILEALRDDLISEEDKICFIQTGSGYKYAENLYK